MEVFSVGVQVPPLAPRSFLDLRIAALALLAVLAACTPDPRDAAAALESELRASEKAPTEALLESMVPASRDLATGLVRQGTWPALRNRLLADLKGAKPVDGEDTGVNVLLRHEGGGGVLLVRDGHSWRLDLALSQAPFAALREAAYPAPW